MTDAEVIAKVRDYATGLRIWSVSDREIEIGNDILYLLSEES